MPTRNQLDLQTLGSQLVMPKNLPDHWIKVKRPLRPSITPTPVIFVSLRFNISSFHNVIDILNSVISTISIPLLLVYPETLRNASSLIQNLTPCCHISLPNIPRVGR